MKGIILAGGTGSRLSPLTRCVNKHLLPVGKQPMIYYAIQKLIECNIKQILIVTGIEHAGSMISSLGSGKEFGCQFTYKVQDEAGGIAQALGLAEDFCKNEKFCVLLGDNIFSNSLKEIAQDYWFMQDNGTARIVLTQVEDPKRYGVVKLLDDKIVEIIEKPKDPPSNHAVAGIYFYDSQVFHIIKELKPSSRGELEITDVNNYYLKNGKLCFSYLNGWWTDAGTFESLAHANSLINQ